MNRQSSAKATTSLQTILARIPAAGSTLNVVVVYEEAQSLKWARGLSGRLEAALGRPLARSTWWKLSELRQPGVLAGAVWAAMRADLIVVAARGTEGLPLPFYIWVNAWLPHRSPGNSALVTLLSKPESQNRESGRLRKYLRAIARRSRMNLLLEEHATPVEPQESWERVVAQRRWSLPDL